MFTLKIENKRGEQFTLSGSPDYTILGIDGIASSSATINTSNTGLRDGADFNSSRANMRNIVLTVGINHPVEINRLRLYQYFKSKQYCRIYFKNGMRNVYIEGYVESLENNLFSQRQTVQISIVCPRPYFKALTAVYSDVSRIVSAFSFPFSIEAEGIEFSYIQKDYIATVNNKGDVDCGIIAVITATGEVVNPIIYSSETGGSFGVKVTMEATDQLIINTNDGEKSVKFIHNGVEYNYINYIMANPEWFTLSAGDNVFSYDAESGIDYLNIYFEHRAFYEGV